MNLWSAAANGGPAAGGDDTRPSRRRGRLSLRLRRLRQRSPYARARPGGPWPGPELLTTAGHVQVGRPRVATGRPPQAPSPARLGYAAAAAAGWHALRLAPRGSGSESVMLMLCTTFKI